MAPSAPKALLILQDVKSSLEAITAGDDYFFTWSDVRIAKEVPQDPVIPVAQPVAYIIPNGEDQVVKRLAGGTYPVVVREMLIGVMGLHYDGPSRTETREIEHAEQMAHDLTKKLITTGKRGNKAIKTLVSKRVPFPEKLERVDSSMWLEFLIHYQHEEDDPSAG